MDYETSIDDIEKNYEQRCHICYGLPCMCYLIDGKICRTWRPYRNITRLITK